MKKLERERVEVAAFRICTIRRVLEVQWQPSAGTWVPPPETRFKPFPGPLGRRRRVGSRSQGEAPISRLGLVDSPESQENR